MILVFNKWVQKASFSQNNRFLFETTVPHPAQSTGCASLCHVI